MGLQISSALQKTEQQRKQELCGSDVITAINARRKMLDMNRQFGNHITEKGLYHEIMLIDKSIYKHQEVMANYIFCNAHFYLLLTSMNNVPLPVYIPEHR